MQRLWWMISSLALMPCVAGAVVIHVGTGHSYATVQAALKASTAYDTLVVHKGFYREGNILIDKPLTLLGEGLPVLDGDKRYEVLTITSSDVTVKGFRVQHSGYATLDDPGGIKVKNSHHVVISHNILYDNFFGVYLEYCNNVMIRDNQIMAFGKEEQEIGNGIHCWKSDTIQIVANRIKGHRDGIYFEFVTNTVVWRNLAEYNVRYGLHFMFSNDDNYYTNTFRNNGAGVAVMFSRRVNMINNKFDQNWGDAAYGLLLKEINDSHINGNRFVNNTSGIFMEGTNRIRAEKNQFEKNGWAMQIQASCMDNTIVANNFTGNTFDVGTNGTVVLNKFVRNYWDKYEGYDLNHDQVGDVPFRPLSLFSVIVEQNPTTMLLFRSFLVTLLDKSEKIFPTLTPEHFIDEEPMMKAYRW